MASTVPFNGHGH